MAQLDQKAADVTAGSSANSNAVANLASLTISDPPTRDEVETIRQKINELIQALRR
jgi:hypothetical protein